MLACMVRRCVSYEALEPHHLLLLSRLALRRVGGRAPGHEDADNDGLQRFVEILLLC